MPEAIEKFSSIEDQTRKVMSDVGEVTGRIKESPLLGLGAPKATPGAAGSATARPAQDRERGG
jgi:hypothetical protein